MKYTLCVNFDYSTVPTNFFCMKIYFNYKTIDFYWYESFEYIMNTNIKYFDLIYVFQINLLKVRFKSKLEL